MRNTGISDIFQQTESRMGPIVDALPQHSDTSFFGHPRGLATLFFTEMWERRLYGTSHAAAHPLYDCGIANWRPRFLGHEIGRDLWLLHFDGLPAEPAGWMGRRSVDRAAESGAVRRHLDCRRKFLPGLAYAARLLRRPGPPDFRNRSVEAKRQYDRRQLYGRDDNRRDAGFSIFYMGINLGAFSPLIVGWVGEKVNWRLFRHLSNRHVGWSRAIPHHEKISWRSRPLPTRSGNIEKDRGHKRNAGFISGAVVFAVVVLGALNSRGTIHISAEAVSDGLGWFLLATSLAVFAWMILGKGWSTQERKRAAAILVLFIASCVFWGAYEQAGSSLNLFAERNTNRHVLGYEFPASWFQWVQPLFVLMLAPLFAWLWVRLRKREPSSPTKFSVGLLFVGLSFLVLVPAASHMGVSPNWLNFSYFLSVVGEMCLSPVGLSAMTKLAPARAAGFVMGVWFLSLSIGDWLAGRAGSLFESVPLPKLFGISRIVPLLAAVVLVF